MVAVWIIHSSLKSVFFFFSLQNSVHFLTECMEAIYGLHLIWKHDSGLSTQRKPMHMQNPHRKAPVHIPICSMHCKKCIFFLDFVHFMSINHFKTWKQLSFHFNFNKTLVDLLGWRICKILLTSMSAVFWAPLTPTNLTYLGCKLMTYQFICSVFRHQMSLYIPC